MTSDDATRLLLDGQSLTVERLVTAAAAHVHVDLTDAAWDRVRQGRAVIDEILASGRTVYGLNTGFGQFSTVRIEPHEIRALQENLIRSHAVGAGAPAPEHLARMLALLRCNTLAKGFSGVREETLRRVLAAYNAGLIPCVPEKGTVGASGDLAPLAHAALSFMGEGEMLDTHTGRFVAAAEAMAQRGLPPIQLHAKEGLALINGTQFMMSYVSLALHRARRAALQADVVAALTLEVLKGTAMAFLPEIHRARPHAGQGAVAARMLALVRPGGVCSELAESHRDCSKVQDSYTLRCIPQIHGVVHDTLDFVERIATTEMNSATDNPMVIVELGGVFSCGNFHGEYPAKAADFLGIGVHELANVSERRTERLVNGALSGLPAFLAHHGGLNSGFMIAHCTAAALTSENKVLVHPASSDTLSTSAAQEDHVSMGGFAARKALTIVENVEVVLAVELLCAAQALDMLRPLRTTAPLERAHAIVRERVRFYDQDRYLKPDLDAAVELIRQGALLAVLE